MALSALADDARALRICSAVSRLLLTHCLPGCKPDAQAHQALCRRSAAPAARELVVWDDDLPGFGVRVKEGGGKSFFVQYRNANGRSRRLTLGRYGVLTPDEARRLARKTLADVAHGLDPAEARQADRRALTIAELCREYLERANAGLVISRRGSAKKGTTLMIDKGRVERHIIPLIGRRPIKDITSADIRAFQRDVTLGKTAADVKTGPRGRAIVKGGRGAATRTLGLLGAIMEYAAQAGYRADNPVRGVRREADRKRTVRLDEAAYRRLGRRLAAAERAGMRWQAVEAIRLIALTGCRCGEITSLRKSEVDVTGQALRLGDSKTGASVRPIGLAAVNALGRTMARSKGQLRLPRCARSRDFSRRRESVAIDRAPPPSRGDAPYLAPFLRQHGRRSRAHVANDRSATRPFRPRGDFRLHPQA